MNNDNSKKNETDFNNNDNDKESEFIAQYIEKQFITPPIYKFIKKKNIGP